MNSRPSFQTFTRTLAFPPKLPPANAFQLKSNNKLGTNGNSEAYGKDTKIPSPRPPSTAKPRWSKTYSPPASYRNNQWDNFLGSMFDTQDGWKRFFKLNRALIRKPPSVKPLLDPNGTLLHDARAKAELFATTMQAQFSTPSHASKFENDIRETLANQLAVPHAPITFFMPGET